MLNYYNGLYRGIVSWGYNIGIREKKMQTTTLNRVHIGVIDPAKMFMYARSFSSRSSHMKEEVACSSATQT